MELSIDTSTEMASLALSEKGDAFAETTWRVGQNHTAQVLPALDALLRRSDRRLEAATAVFVAIGPGSFNGVRVGASTAKGLAFSLDVPIVGVGTLEVEAHPFAQAGLPVWAIHDIGRGELAAACYASRDGTWQALENEHVTTFEQLADKVISRAVFCGELSQGLAQALAARFGDMAVIPGAGARLRRAGHLASLGWKRLQAGRVDDVATLQPLYMRRPHITIPKHHP